jgi:parallel beta-helix repeat protein/predicted outer membrane repeat protein
MIRRILLPGLSALLLLPHLASAEIIWVPDHYERIKWAINATSPGDTVMVRPGSYLEATAGFPNFDIVVMSEHGADSTVVILEGSNWIFSMDAGNTAATVLEGFTIREAPYAVTVSGGGAATIRKNIFTENTHGVHCQTKATPLIVDNVFTGNTYGINVDWSAYPEIRGNLITENYHPASQGAGIRLVHDSSALIVDNIITRNTSAYGSGVLISGNGEVVIENTLFANNSSSGLYWGGAAIHCAGATLEINNCTFADNIQSGDGPGGAIYMGTESGTIVNSIFYRNYASDGPDLAIGGSAGLYYTWLGSGGGNIYLYPGSGYIWNDSTMVGDPIFAEGPQGSYCLSQLDAGQSEQSPCVDAGDPASEVPDGTTRTDQMPDAGIVDLGYHYRFPAVMITLTPLNPPIVVPQGGGSFDFNVQVENTTDEAQTFDIWTEVWLPQFGTVPLIVLEGFTLPAGISVNRDLTQTVPAFAPGGTYTYWGYIGEHPWVIHHAHYFNFDKEGNASRGTLGSPADWPHSGKAITEPDITK